jgi:hypothetical protein
MELHVLSLRVLVPAFTAAALAGCVRKDASPERRPVPAPTAPEPAMALPPVAIAPVPASASPGPAVAAAPAPVPPAEPPPPAPLPSGTTVLHVGDSFAGALGVALNAELKRQGVRGFLRYKTATFIPDWAFGPKLPLYIAQTNPDLVLINLGANEVQMFEPRQRAKTIQRLVGHMKGRPCVWIGPPVWAGDTGILSVIRENCGPCRFMDSNALYPDMPRLPDKIHPTMPAREEWARRVVDWLARERRPAPERPWELAPEMTVGSQ